jgi:hypothetical protein
MLRFLHYLQALSVFCAVDCVIVNSVLHCALNQTGLGVDWRPDLTATNPTLVKQRTQLRNGGFGQVPLLHIWAVNLDPDRCCYHSRLPDSLLEVHLCFFETVCAPWSPKAPSGLCIHCRVAICVCCVAANRVCDGTELSRGRTQPTEWLTYYLGIAQITGLCSSLKMILFGGCCLKLK